MEIQENEVHAGMLAEEVDSKISKILASESSLDKGYVELGLLLREMNVNKYWKLLNYKSYGAYIKELGEKYGKSRSQLYHYFSVIKELEPYILPADLNAMGIAKANVLRASVKRTGFPPSREIIQHAISSCTAAELRKLVFDDDNGQPERGSWYDQEGFYLTEEERLIIKSADEAALKTDPVVSADAPAWVQRKESRLRLSMEYLATHSK